MLTLERLKSVAGQAEQHLRAWGLSRVSVECEDDEEVLAINVVDGAKSFAETFAIVRHDGWMSIDLNPRNRLVIKVDDWGDQDLSLMFAFSALSNLLSSKTGWLPLTDTTLILSWGYDHKESAWEVEVLAIKDVAYTDPPSEVTLTLNAKLLKGERAALSGLLCGKEWDITFKRTGSFHSLMRALVGLVLAFAACNDHNLKVVNSCDRQGCI
jgi:hypothetical protein